jgi:DNA-binding transcriptional regulator YhcF (GntR family)
MSSAFTKQTFTWLHQINRDRRLLAIDLCVAVELTKYFNEKDHGGRAWPSLRTLGAAIGLHEVTVLRSMRRLEVNGHLQVVWGQRGRGHPSQYWMIVKPAATQVLEAKKPAATQVLKPAAQSIKPAAQSIKPAATQQNLLKNQEGSKREHALSPDDASLGKKRKSRAREESKLPAKEQKSVYHDGKPPEPPAELVPVADDAFLRFWAVYPRKVEQADARAAFAKAIKDGADADAVIARATCYALERANAIAGGDDPKFTLYPATWLKKKKWNDPYPEGAVYDEAGNIVAIEQEDEQEEEVDPYDAVMAMAPQLWPNWK